jgi:hypothetical protein
MVKKNQVLSINWKKMLSIYGKGKHMTGEDIVMCLLTRKKTKLKGIGNPKAVGFHIAKPNFSYWNTFLAQDKFVIKAFKGIISKEDFQEVYSYLY